MHYKDVQVVFQEVPGEISICFTITGCMLRCKGCHSPYLWNRESGYVLTRDVYEGILSKYQGFATCILFMGGEWYKDELIEYLKYARINGYETCLYTGLEEVEKDILAELTWIKTGPWVPELGGIDQPTSNQKFIEVKTNLTLNHLFIKN